jgi:hypothetical protein
MTDIDLSRLPTGARGWAALVAWAAASDDRLERYFLEFKSDIDLSTKHGRHKVAKFILGAANRDPAKAAKRFGGHAVLLLGVGSGKATGIPPFEAQDLEREVLKFVGADGPSRDYEQIPIDTDHDVIAIIVDPPIGRIWPCLADGEGMKNGDIYLRGDGKTEKATGTEIQAMLARRTTASTLPEITVDPVGCALSARINIEELTAQIEDAARDYLDDVDPPCGALSFRPLPTREHGTPHGKRVPPPSPALARARPRGPTVRVLRVRGKGRHMLSAAGDKPREDAAT